MAIKKKQLGLGIGLTIVFWAVLIAMFMPLFDGTNAFDASDSLFNSISKGSTHKIPGLLEQAKKYDGKTESLALEIEDDQMRKNALTLLTAYGFDAEVTGAALTVTGDYGKLLNSALVDADDMFFNRGEAVKKRIGLEERLGLYTWWHILKAAEEAFTKKKGKDNFAAAKMAHDVNAKGVEVGYNFYTIEPESVRSKAGILIFALVFYVLYTLWWGYAIYYIAEGMGLQLTGGKKKEA